jgi:6-pyruvoyltetrahydropterin/6-carboxytetrahydropterin synthase
MTYRITKDFEFSAAHHLDGLVPGHQCGRDHGHNYRVRVQLTAPMLDDHGFVLDYGDLAPLKAWIDATLDHRDLNAVWPELGNPTAETLARELATVVRKQCGVPDTITIAVGVSETPKTWAWFLP